MNTRPRKQIVNSFVGVCGIFERGRRGGACMLCHSHYGATQDTAGGTASIIAGRGAQVCEHIPSRVCKRHDGGDFCVSQTASLEGELCEADTPRGTLFLAARRAGDIRPHWQCPLAGCLLLRVAAAHRYGPAPGMEDGMLQLQHCGTMSISFQNFETNQP